MPSVELAGRVAVIQGADGRIPLLEGSPRSGGRVGSEGSHARDPAWKVRVETVSARDVQLALGDRSYEQPITYDAHVVSATVRNVTNDGKAPMRFEAALRLAQGGTVDGSGTIAQSLDGVEALVEMKQVSLAPSAPCSPAMQRSISDPVTSPRPRAWATRRAVRGWRSVPPGRSPSATSS